MRLNVFLGGVSLRSSRSLFLLSICILGNIHPRPIHAAALAAGDEHSLALLHNGTVVGWGANWDGEADGWRAGGNNVAIAAGHYHSIALKADGTVVGWGDNTNGQSYFGVFQTGDNIAIAGGWGHSLVLNSDGTVEGFTDPGENEYGEATGSNFNGNNRAIAAGKRFSLALKNDGTVAGLGEEDHGLSHGALAGSDNVAISASNTHALALKSDGTVVAWGYNGEGQTDTLLIGGNNVAIAAGGYHSLALKEDGTVVGWGYNFYGQADGSLAGNNIVAIAAGGFHNLALKNDGTVVAWGGCWADQTAVPAGLILNVLADWKSPTGGNFLGSHNWRNDTPSTAASDAHFAINADYTVTFTVDALARNVVVLEGNVAFDLGQHDYSIGTDLRIDDGGALTVTQGAVNVTGTTKLWGGGSLTLDGGTLDTHDFDASLGTFNFISGTLRVAGTATFPENTTLNIAANSKFVNAQGISVPVVVANGGLVTGSGSFANLAVSSGGTVSPGSSPGMFSDGDNSNTVWNGSGRYLWEINQLAVDGGTAGNDPGWDVWDTGELSVNANANSKFIIEIRSLGQSNEEGALQNLESAIEHEWLIATATNIGGIFNTILDSLGIDTSQFANQNGPGQFELFSDDNGRELWLRFTAAPNGDFNEDGNFDANDYVMWRKTDRTPAGYNAWRSNFGQPSGSGASVIENASVPEPPTMMLLMLAAAGWCLFRGRAA